MKNQKEIETAYYNETRRLSMAGYNWIAAKSVAESRIYGMFPAESVKEFLKRMYGKHINEQ